jgi:hypothetical protein
VICNYYTSTSMLENQKSVLQVIAEIVYIS